MLLSLALLLASAAAQSILPTTSDSTFPACALSCPNLLSAQTQCIPPTQPVTDQYIYDQCFCQQPLIEGLLNSPDGPCDTSCTVESDRILLQQWYISFCTQVDNTQVPTQQVAATTSTTSSSSTVSDTVVTSTILSATTSSPTTLVTSPVTPTIVVVTITSTNPATSTPSSQPASGVAAAPKKSWIDTHWQWILMIVILIIGLGLLAWLALWLKKRHNRKSEQRLAAASGFPPAQERDRTNTNMSEKRNSTATLEDMFGPHQHQHLSRGWEYTNEQRRELGLGGFAAAIRQKSRERKQSREGNRRDGGRKGKSRETSSKAKDFKTLSRTRSRSERQAENQREFDRDTQSRRQEQRDLQEKDVDEIERG